LRDAEPDTPDEGHESTRAGRAKTGEALEGFVEGTGAAEQKAGDAGLVRVVLCMLFILGAQRSSEPPSTFFFKFHHSVFGRARP